jgi:hypothetical protein
MAFSPLPNMNPSHIIVTPKSSKAKNRLANIMGKDPICQVEQTLDGKFFLASSNRKYFFWVDAHNDPNWSLN